jgi:hypothetical protein
MRSRATLSCRHALSLAFLLCGASAGRAATLPPAIAAAQDALVAAEQPDLRSSDWRLRLRAFYKITAAIRGAAGSGALDPAQATSSARHAVTSLLAAEVPGIRTDQPSIQPTATDGESNDREASSAYLAGLVEAVLALHDPGSIPVLYQPYVLETGGMATQALAYFGHSEARRVFNLFTHAKDRRFGASLQMVIMHMLSDHTLDDQDTLQAVEKTFLADAQSSKPGERLMATRGLSYFSDPEARATLTAMAESDSYANVPGLDGKRGYDIREAAALALRGPIVW